MGRAKMLTSTAARYLPIYVHIGSQHQLHVPPGEPPLRLGLLQDSAEDAETVVVLAEQDALSGAAPTPQDATGAMEQQRAAGNMEYRGLGVPAYRSYLNVLSYHRMLAIRQRAAALCAAAVGRDTLMSRREPARPAELCEDIAPPLELAAASGSVPPSRPQPSMPATAHPESSRSVLKPSIASLCMWKVPPRWACWGWRCELISVSVWEHRQEHPVVSPESGSNL